MAYNSTTYSAPVASLPPQMIPKDKKSKEWGMACMDALEMIGKSQHTTNIKLIENYEMVKGQFIFRHYFDDQGYADMLNQLTKEFDLPSYLRHYDIISPIINTLSGEYQKRPDNFRVRGFSEDITNEYIRTKTKMILDYVQQKIKAEIDQQLIAKGLDPNKQDFKSPQEQQQYQQTVDQQRQALTPPQIQKYMDTKWQHAAEIWGQQQLELDRERFNLPEKEKREFEDMLIADRCFRHFRLTGNGYMQETWNPINTFFHKSPEIDAVEEGDYAGRVFYLTIADVIDRYGHLMDKSDIEALQGDVDFAIWKEKDGYGIYYGSVVPYAGYPQQKVVMDTIGHNPGTSMGIPTLGADFFAGLHTDNYALDTRGLTQVTEGYWKSQRKIGKVTYMDDESGLKLSRLVDEDFIVPQGFKQIDRGTLYDVMEAGTVVWTWVNQVWQGLKINFSQFSNIDRDIYLNIKPLEFQFKGDLNPYAAKLPVCGQLFSPRNSKSMSLVDRLKPHQIGHNVSMNQLYQIMEREVGRFVVMDMNMFPNMKDWGGERGWEKFMSIAKGLGLAPVDTSPQNTKGASAAGGGFFPKIIDLDESARMISRINLANAFEQMAFKQIGFNAARLGQFTTSDTATGIQQGAQASYNATESYFTDFSNYLRRVHKMNLDIAQYVQSQNLDVTITYVKSDLSRAFTNLNGTELMLSDLSVYISNSQEMLRQLETLRKLAIENNTTGATVLDLATIVTSNSPAEIKVQLETSLKAQQARTDRQMDLEQQKIQQEKEIRQMELENENAENQKNRDSKEKVASITAAPKFAKLGEGEGGGPDDLDYQKFGVQQQESANKTQTANNKLQLEREKALAEKEYNYKKLTLEQQKIIASERNQDKKLEVAKILKDKPTGPKKRK